MKKSMKKVFAAAVGCAILAVAGMTVAANDEAVTVAYPAIADGLIQRLAVPGQPETVAYSQMTDTLLARNAEGEYEPRLAESWEVNEDSTVFTFHLRNDVKWNDGEPLTAKDVAFTINMIKDEAAGYGLLVSNMQGAEAVDDYTCVITMEKPNVALIPVLASHPYASIMPAHGDEMWGDEYGRSAEKTLCCGPYILTEWIPDVSMTFEANPDYYRGEPDIKKVIYREIQDVNSAVVALQTGELDAWFSPITGTSYDMLSASENVKIETYTSGRNEAVYMNCKSGIFADPEVRRAVCYAINKEEALTIGARGLGQIIRWPGDIGSMMNGNPVDYVSEYEYSYDLEKAQQMIKDLGLEGTEIVVSSYNTEPYQSLGIWLADALTKAGFNAKPEPMERAAFLEKMSANELDIFPLSWIGQTYDIDECLPSAVYGPNGGSCNDGFYADDEMDEMVLASRACADPEERQEIMKGIVDKFLEDAVFVSTFAFEYAIPYSAELTCDNIRSYSMFDYHWAE